MTVIEKQQGLRKQIAYNIISCMKVRDMTRGDLAEELNKYPSEISKMLKGNHNFTIDTLVEIAFVLEIDISAFFKRTTFNPDKE